MFQDARDETPDSIFPNNWFSTHSGGHVAVYPMYAESRRRERRWDVIEMLKRRLPGGRRDRLFRAGTGRSVAGGHRRDGAGPYRAAGLVARSHRADPILLERFCTRFGYEPIVFDAVDDSGTPVYHTNVLMSDRHRDRDGRAGSWSRTTANAAPPLSSGLSRNPARGDRAEPPPDRRILPATRSSWKRPGRPDPGPVGTRAGGAEPRSDRRHS